MSLLYSHLKLFHSDITVQKQNIVQYLVLTLFSVSESQIKLQKNLSGSDGKQEFYTFSTKLGDFSTTTTVDVRGGHIESQNRSKKKKKLLRRNSSLFFPHLEVGISDFQVQIEHSKKQLLQIINSLGRISCRGLCYRETEEASN